jgi:Camelysin metallo-endopeptidase
MSVRHLISKRVAAAVSIPIAMVASGAMVWHASYSAFSATTTNPTSNWAAGTVALSDDDSNTALFNASNLKPGSTGSKCIAVTSTGSLPSAVKLYGTSYATTNALSTYLTVTVDEGTGGSFAGGCTGFSSSAQIYNGTLAAFGTGKTNYATGVGNWAPTGSASETKVYKVTYTLSSSTPDTAQGGTAALGFTWEAQNS